MKNISEIKNCYGCGVCSMSCPKNIIDLRLNASGFYEPYITNIKSCINCGLCISVCSYISNEKCIDDVDIKGYAGWSENTTTRHECSSGGIGYEIVKQLMTKGYEPCVVRYNIDKQRAEHYIATTIEALEDSKGSKYIQSYTCDGFKSINRKDKYVVTGSPCQIASLRKYIRKFKIEDNFILVDFFCHGVPSKLIWDKYCKENLSNITNLKKVTWRNKKNGWHDSYAISTNYNYYSKYSDGDIFYRLFLEDTCLGKACYLNCKYKYLSSEADIRIGDLWGKTYRKDDLGVSGMLTFTHKGEDVIKFLHNCNIIHTDINIVTEGQMKKSPEIPYFYKLNILWLRTNFSLEKCIWLINLGKRIVRRLKL